LRLRKTYSAPTLLSLARNIRKEKNIMKAITYTEYGSPKVLRTEEIEKPTPNENQVLVKVHSTSINAQDYRVRNGKPFVMRLMIGSLLRPKNTRVGTDFAGRVEAVGTSVKQFKPGDEVFGCARGAFAEYVCARKDMLTLKPANVSCEQAASAPVAGLTALQAIRYTGGIKPGQKVLIQGASGGVGMYVVQIAKEFGAEVTAVCSPRNLEMARSIGADHVIDYTKEDFTRNTQHYDLIIAINGYHSIFAYRRALKPQGTYVSAGGTLLQFFQAMLLGSLLSKDGGRKMSSMGIAEVKQDDLTMLAKLLEAGKITPYIDRQYPLNEIVKAFQYVEEKHAQGKVMVQIS